MTPGIHQIKMMDYLALPYLSSGLCHTLLTCSPAHAKFEQEHERESSSEADIGTVAHSALLEGNLDFVTVIDRNHYVGKKGGVPIGWTNDAIREARDAARAAGKTPILLDDMPAIEAMVKTAKDYIASSKIAGMFDSGAAEQTIVWQEGDVLCKARPDWLTADHSILLHYKTTKMSVQPDSFSRTAINMGYDVAVLFYARGLEATVGHENTRHLILAQEQIEPYACKLFGLGNSQVDISQRKVERALTTWTACMKSGKFPAYDGSVHVIEPTPWGLAQAESDMLTDKELEHGIPF